MALTEQVLAKLAAASLSNENVRKGIGWLLVAAMSPLILIVSVLCAMAGGSAEHNNTAVKACFYGAAYTEAVPAEYKTHIAEMQTAFSLLDSAVAAANGQADAGGSLDPLLVKTVFFALCFGEEAPSRRAAGRFAGCFYTTEERIREVEKENEDGELTVEEETYIALVPLPLETAYRNLASELGREIRSDDRKNAMAVYRMIAGPMGGGSYDGSYLPGSGASIEIDLELFSDPTTKNNADLAAYAINAWESGWGYVWGTYGQVLTESLFYVRDAFVMCSLDQFSEYEHLEKILLDAVCSEPVIYGEESLDMPVQDRAQKEKYKKYRTEDYVPVPHYKRED